MMLRFVVMILSSAALGGQVRRPEPLSVCEVLSKLSSYQGQRITVRGEFVGGDEGFYLIAGGCRPLITDGYRWPMPSPIALTYPGSPGLRDSKSPTPSARVEQVDPDVLRSAGPGAKIYVTVTGRLDTKAHFEMVLRGDGKVVPNGYGHQAACPAQIVYEEMKDSSVVSAKR